MKWKIVTALMTLTVKGSMGITEYIKVGSKAEITCHRNDGDQPEFCSFTRPDGLVLCQAGTAYPEKIPHNCVNDPSIKQIEIGHDFCKVELSRATTHHLGRWLCLSLNWGSEETKSITLAEVKAEVELLDIWGTAHLEIGIEQTFRCSLLSSQMLKPLKWYLTYPNKDIEFLGAPTLENDQSQDSMVSSIAFTPKAEHDSGVISCKSEESQQFDSFEMVLYKFTEMESSFESSIAEEGEPLEKTFTFSAFPPPRKNNTKWIIKLPSQTITLNPGHNYDVFTASNIEALGEDVYKIGLLIDKVSRDVGRYEHALEIHISDHIRQIRIPFKIEILTKDGRILNEDAKVVSENVSLFIIIGICILCLFLCILFYFCKCYNKRQKEESIDEEDSVVDKEVQKDKKEIEPLMDPSKVISE